MTYRNDHDAALARVDALRHEVERLKDENSKLKASAPGECPPRQNEKRATPAEERSERSSEGGALVAAVLGLVIVGSIGDALNSDKVDDTNSEGAPPAQLMPAAPSSPVAGPEPQRPTDEALALAACADAIDDDFSIPSPRVPLDVTALVRTAASCREQLRKAAASSVAAHHWAQAEDNLDERISALVVYYAREPATMDDYTTASTLWNEYFEALIVRNATLAPWRATH